MEQQSLVEPNTMDDINTVGPSSWLGVTIVIKIAVTQAKLLPDKTSYSLTLVGHYHCIINKHEGNVCHSVTLSFVNEKHLLIA